MSALLIALIVVALTVVALIIIVLPVLRGSGAVIPPMEIPLSEIAPIWTKHNFNVTPLAKNEIENFEELESPVADQAAETPDQGKVYVLKQAEKLRKTAGQSNESPAAPPLQQKTPVENKTGKPNGLSLSALAEPLKSLWDDCIAPYKKTIENQEAEAVIMEILQLLEKHGHYPSVVIDSKDSESVDMITVRDNLVNITLRDHSYSVCRYMVGSLKESNHDYEHIVPITLVTSLAHDLGKIPEFRLSGLYNTKDHALASAGKLAELTDGINPVWKKKAIQAVSHHHTESKDDITVMLKRADRQARQAELATCTRSQTIKQFEEWFDLKKYLKEYVAPGVNVSQTGKWNAVSFKGSIYAKPDWLYEQGRRMCHAENALDVLFIYISEKDNATRKIINCMRKENMTPLIGENYLGRKFDIKTATHVRKPQVLYLTAFTAPDYIDLVEMESRKVGFTEIIEAVVPL